MSLSTIEDRIEFEDDSTLDGTLSTGQKKTITEYRTSILSQIKDGDDIIQYPTNNILYEYLDLIIPLCSTYQMTDEEYKRYYMRPDLFCYDKYKDQDLEWIILALNNILSPKDFTKNKIKYIHESAINELMSAVINAERDLIIYNRNKLNE